MRILRTIADRLHPYSSTAIKETAERKISCGLISSNDTTDGLAQLVSLALGDFRQGTLVQYTVDRWDQEGKRDIIERVGIVNGKFYVANQYEQLVALDMFGCSANDKAPTPTVRVKEIDGVHYASFKSPYMTYNLAIAPAGVAIPRPEER